MGALGARTVARLGQVSKFAAQFLKIDSNGKTYTYERY